jgi:hypothetical protein
MNVVRLASEQEAMQERQRGHCCICGKTFRAPRNPWSRGRPRRRTCGRACAKRYRVEFLGITSPKKPSLKKPPLRLAPARPGKSKPPPLLPPRLPAWQPPANARFSSTRGSTAWWGPLPKVRRATISREATSLGVGSAMKRAMQQSPGRV